MIADAAERVVGEVGPSGTGEQEGIDPWAEAVTRKGPQKALFCAFSVSDDHRADEAFFQFGPERKKRRGLDKILVVDAMDLARRPLYWLIGMKVGNEWSLIATLDRPGHQPNLHWGICHPGCGTRRLEVDGGEAALADKLQEARIWFLKENLGEAPGPHTADVTPAASFSIFNCQKNRRREAAAPCRD